jgi:MoxR-like ATPase
VDRFMMKVLVDYPSDEEEFVIVQRVIGNPALVTPVASTEDLGALQRACKQVYIDPALIQYAVQLVGASRRPADYDLKDMASLITYGASPRASISLIEAARALAMMRGRRYVLTEDVKDLVHDVLRHRLVLSYEALSQGITPDSVIERIMQRVPAPAKPIAHSEAEDERRAA